MKKREKVNLTKVVSIILTIITCIALSFVGGTIGSKLFASKSMPEAEVTSLVENAERVWYEGAYLASELDFEGFDVYISEYGIKLEPLKARTTPIFVEFENGDANPIEEYSRFTKIMMQFFTLIGFLIGLMISPVWKKIFQKRKG